MTQLKALVTGGSRGIGRAIACKLRSEKIEVFSPSRSELDLSDNDSINKYLSEINQNIDILVNNAGINIIAGVDEFLEKDFEQTLQINLLAPIKLARAVIPEMKKKRKGRIVNVSSIWSLVSKARRITYTASKAALNGFTTSLAIELAPYNILVNAVAPGYVNTELTAQNNSIKDIVAIKEIIPLNRLAEPDEIAELVYFLASERNTYITGQVITIDGGFTCQ